MFFSQKIRNKVNEIRKSYIIQKNDKILIAFSGGPDSVFLYYILNELKKEFDLELSLLYVNHNLRMDVDKDILFVKKFAAENNISLYIENVDVNNYSEKNKISTELAARELRYEKLYEVLKKISYNKIATGHNLDDNIETVIFRLLRGTSVKGLKGIPRQRDVIIRPILNFEKSLILEVLEENNQKFIIDYTNKENDYTRNYIRNEIFPMFSKVNSGFKRKINELILEINGNSEESDNLENIGNFVSQKKNNLKNLIELLEKNNISLSRQKVNQIYNTLYDKKGEILNNGNKEFYLGNGKILRKEYNNIKILFKKENVLNENEDAKEYNKIQLKRNQSIEWYNYEVGYYESDKFENLKNFEEVKKIELENEKKLKIFKIRDLVNEIKIYIKQRENGDKIFIEKVGNKKVKKVLIDKKVLKWERDNIPIIELENESNGEKEILLIGDMEFSYKMKKIKDTEELKEMGNSDILVIRRKNEQ